VRNASQKAERSDIAARREHLQSPEIVQQTSAVRHPSTPEAEELQIGNGLKWVDGVLTLDIDTEQFKFNNGELQTKLDEC